MRLYSTVLILGLAACDAAPEASDNSKPVPVTPIAEASGALVPHTVAENVPLSRLGGVERGRRIGLEVATIITKYDCRALLREYRAQAQPGQIAVRLAGQEHGDLEGLPLCVDNFDPSGPTVYDFMWK